MTDKLKLSDKDLYLLLYDFLKNFHGSYPFTTQENGQTNHFQGELFKHFMRKMLMIDHRTCGAEMDIIQILREHKSSMIVRMAIEFHPVLSKRNDCEEKIVYIRKEQGRIRQKCIQFRREKAKESDTSENDTVYSNIKEFTEATGQRFRMKKEQAIRHKKGEITREEAFQEIYGSTK